MKAMYTNTIEKLYQNVAPLPGEETLDELGAKNHWSTSRFENNGHWRFEILTDSTPLPEKARERIRMIEDTGIDVEWLVAHELETQPITIPEVKMPEIIITEEDKEIIYKILFVVAVAMAVVIFLPLVLVFGFFALGALGCLSGDPVLIAVTKDEKGERKWTSCYRWYDES